MLLNQPRLVPIYMYMNRVRQLARSQLACSQLPPVKAATQQILQHFMKSKSICSLLPYSFSMRWIAICYEHKAAGGFAPNEVCAAKVRTTLLPEYKNHTLFLTKMAKIDTLFTTNSAENPTLWGRTYLSSRYKGVPPSRG